jgi:hypothetical protein
VRSTGSSVIGLQISGKKGLGFRSHQRHFQGKFVTSLLVPVLEGPRSNTNYLKLTEWVMAQYEHELLTFPSSWTKKFLLLSKHFPFDFGTTPSI